MPVGKHTGALLGTLGRRTIYGYAFLSAKHQDCEIALAHLRALLEEIDDGTAAAYRMTFGPRRGKPLGTLQKITLRRLHAIAERELARSSIMEELRTVAQTYLSHTPPGFPQVARNPLSSRLRADADEAYAEALDEFAAVEALSNDASAAMLTEQERVLQQQLFQRAAAACAVPQYVQLRWNRADAPSRGRECGVLYESATRSYLFLAHILATTSRHRRPLVVKQPLVDINNPDVTFTGGSKPSNARLFRLAFSTHQHRLLDMARQRSHVWKVRGATSGSLE